MGSSSAGVMDFKPIDNYDVNDIPPDAPEGQYEMKVAGTKITVNKDTGYPSLIIDFKIAEAADDDNVTAVGATVSDFISFDPSSRAGKFGKQKLKTLLEKLEIPSDLVPTAIRSKADFKPLEDALKAATKTQTITGWIKHRQRENETLCNVQFTEPSSAAAGGLGTVPDEDEDEKPVAKGRSGASAGAGGAAGKKTSKKR